MPQILVYGNERLEQPSLLANISAQVSALDAAGFLTPAAREQVLRQVAELDGAKGFEEFQLQYLAPGATSLREESWSVTGLDEEGDPLLLADGRALYLDYRLTTNIPHLEV